MSQPSTASLFPGLSFGTVLSLGGDCEAAHGLRVADRHGIRGVFDWLVTPLDAIGAILADDGARLGSSFISAQGGTSVRCGAYGVLYHHEFPRDEHNQVVFSSEILTNCREKLAHKMRAFLSACESGRGPVLFVRVNVGTNLPWDRLVDAEAEAGMGDLDRLAATFSVRFPALDFRILLMIVGEPGDQAVAGPADPRVVVVHVLRREEGGWAVADDAWRALFARMETGAPGGNRPVDEKLYWFPDDIPAAPNDPACDPGRGASDGFSADPAPDPGWQAGLRLRADGQASEALVEFAAAYGRGCREFRFLYDYLGLLTGERRYGEVPRLVAQLGAEGTAAECPEAMRYLAMLAGHAKLALAIPRDPEIALAEARRSSAAWLDAPALRARIGAAMRDRQPFALIRLGDGEARFLLGEEPGGGFDLTHDETDAMGDVVWANWFGTSRTATEPARRAELKAVFRRAVEAADVVGAGTPGRLRADTGHFGYLSWLERWLRDCLGGRPDVLFTDAQVHTALNAETPFLEDLLSGQDVVGIISPHPGLAEALARRLRIGRVISHVIPAEGRLPEAAETRAQGHHFPEIYDRLLETLSVPAPGCVFLVAGGLLGKIYCARIRELGGIALDIGALADAWMGYDTRDGQFAAAPRLEIPGAQDDPGPTASEATDHATTYGCISLGKTGSMALAAAIHDAGLPEAIHLHYLGPRALALRGSVPEPEPMFHLAADVAARIGDPACRFRLVSAVRDPIARILSQAFYRADAHRESTGTDIVSDPEALIAWWEESPLAPPDIWSRWFDDTFKATFGFDFREHPFDHERKSLRFASPRLRLLVLRQEDEASRREAELGWLLDRAGVVLSSVNDSTSQNYEAVYRPFVATFVAPAAWLDTYYETEVARHFYSTEEREAFRARWSRPRASASAGWTAVEHRVSQPDASAADHVQP